jgi:hypothetical protein
MLLAICVGCVLGVRLGGELDVCLLAMLGCTYAVGCVPCCAGPGDCPWLHTVACVVLASHCKTCSGCNVLYFDPQV